MDRLLSYIEPVLHIALIAVAVAASWIYWQSANPQRLREAPTIHADFSQVLSRWRASEYRIFLFMSPTCPYCDRSMDFYARLGRTVDSLLQLSSLSAVGVLEVPIVAILDPSGRTRSAWRGLQDSTGEREILAAVRAMGATP